MSATKLFAVAALITMTPVLTAAGNGRIPAGHLPPPGECKIWYDGRPAGHQPPPVDCATAERTVPYGARVIYGSGAPVRAAVVYECAYPVTACTDPRHDHHREYRGEEDRRYEAERHDDHGQYRDERDRRYEREQAFEDRVYRDEDRYYDDDDQQYDRYEPDQEPIPSPPPPAVEPRPEPSVESYPRSQPRARDTRPLFGPGETSVILDGVEFESDSIDFTQQAAWVLDGVADSLLAEPDLMVEIGGHTDSKGDADYNQLLSLMRAEAVRDYLVAAGVDAGRLYVRGYGEERPIASNRKALGRAQNRRVELRRVDGS